MKRKIYDSLLAWKADSDRKPLILEGARQVGKTYILMEFGKCEYDNLIYINCQNNSFMQNLFTMDFDMERILRDISAYAGQGIVPGKTLIFFDEAQDAPRCVEALKYFCEDAREQHVVVAGSLLGLLTHQNVSYPVGKVNTLQLYPMSFEEFLWAKSEDILCGVLDEMDWRSIMPFDNKLQDLLRQYYYVGGMPEAVQSFIQYKDWMEVREIQQEILKSYERDFSKHAPTEIAPRIHDLWLSLPAQLSKENRKFIYGLVKEGARAREYELALQWLIDGGLIHRVNAVKAPRLPLKSYEDRSAFKVFSIDIGLLGAMAGLDSRTLIQGNSIFTEFKGALTEQYVLQQLIIHHELFYYSKPNSSQEIDFLLQQGSAIIPIEVKAEVNVKAKSLRQFTLEQGTPLAYRLSMNDYKQEEWLTNFPLYMAHCL